MGLFDEFGKALKKVEDEVKKADPAKHLKDAEDQLNKAGKEISGKGGGILPPAQMAASLPAAPSGARPAGNSRQPHPGYAKIAAWMKTRYRDRIAGTGQQTLQLEQLSAEASSGLSAKVKKGFLEYLKKQNYEPLLK